MSQIKDMLSNPILKTIANYTPGKPIEELKREYGLRQIAKLASNENPFGPSPKAIRVIRRLANGVHRYPDAGAYYLKNALAKRFAVQADRILLVNGSDESIVLTIRAFVKPDEHVLTAKPTFLIYRIAAQVHGVGVKEVAMRGHRYDLEAMRKAITKKTKVIFIANPDNPIGTYVTHRELKRFVNSVPRRVLIFLDEAYYEFAQKRSNYPRSFEFLRRPNVIISRSFSKAYGLAGLRVGYAFGNRNVMGVLDKVREPFNVNILAQEAARAALADRSYLKRVLRTTDLEKKRLYRAFAALGVYYLESATNFVLVRVGPRAGHIYQALLKKGIIIRSMNAWGLNDYLRITVGTPGENKRFISVFHDILKRNEGGSK